jgi:multiple RNA-binding domain-containing protein 1
MEEATGGDGDARTLFVKNLNFDTTEDTLQRAFEAIGPVRSVTITKRKNTKTTGRDKDKAFLSMGYGFVEYVTAEAAQSAMRKLQNVEVDSHRLNLKLSQRSASSSSSGATQSTQPTDAATSATGKRKVSETMAVPAGSKAPSSKILVKNLAFEAGPKDLRQLFGTFGQIKSVRMPKKFDGAHRGFGFVDFVTKNEALQAFQALANTHLYGRHLVLDWAKAVRLC